MSRAKPIKISTHPQVNRYHVVDVYFQLWSVTSWTRVLYLLSGRYDRIETTRIIISGFNRKPTIITMTDTHSRSTTTGRSQSLNPPLAKRGYRGFPGYWTFITCREPIDMALHIVYPATAADGWLWFRADDPTSGWDLLPPLLNRTERPFVIYPNPREMPRNAF